MERRLYDAAREGNVRALLKLLDEDPILLDRSRSMGTYAETPLHIAAMLGHLDFANEILRRMPNLATERDLHGSTPLHLASSTNNVEMVGVLTNNNPGACLARDKLGRNPVHVAAMRGQIEVLNRLLQVNEDAARVRTDQGGTILHLCVRYNQLEALKVLVEGVSDDEFVNLVDRDNNTVLQIAVLDQLSEAVKFLLQQTNINVNAVNAHGQTALDILYMHDKSTIGQALLTAGALSSTQSPQLNLRQQATSQGSLHKYFKEKQEAVMIAASLIAAASFQAAVNPPGGVWQETIKADGSEDKTPHMAGLSIVAYRKPTLYKLFAVENTIGFIASLFVFLLILSGLPFKYKSFTSVYMVAIWVSIVAIAASFFSSLITVAPPLEYDKVLAIAIVGLVVSVVLWVFVILWYVGLGPKVVGLIRNCKCWDKRSSTTEATPITRAPTV